MSKRCVYLHFKFSPKIYLMKKLVMPVLLLAAVSTVTAQTTKPAVPKYNGPAKVQPTKPVVAKKTPVMPMKNLVDSFSYAAGYNIALNMKDQGITGINTALLHKALDDVFQNNTPQLNTDQVNSSLQKQLQEFATKKAEAAKAAGRAFLEENKKKQGVITLPNGLQYEVMTLGDLTSNKPKEIDTVVVNYAGTLINGMEFDNSFKRGQPAVFPLNGVIKGWTEILKLMNVGAKWKVFIPTELAYDMNPRDPNVIPPGSALIFEISLEGIKPAAAVDH
jgi:FKBP-type peptidyl-prolyl cis-trans isomerase